MKLSTARDKESIQNYIIQKKKTRENARRLFSHPNDFNFPIKKGEKNGGTTVVSEITTQESRNWGLRITTQLLRKDQTISSYIPVKTIQ